MTDQAIQDIAELPNEVDNTFFNAKATAETNMEELNATPRQAFGEYLSGPLHPLLQNEFGDYRAWFVQGKNVQQLENGKSIVSGF